MSQKQNNELPQLLANVLKDGIRFNATKNSARVTFGKLCRIIVEGSSKALLNYFEQHNDVSQFEEWLCQPNIQKTIRRLTIRGVISQEQAAALHPRENQSESRSFNELLPSMDLSLLIILVKYLCHLKPHDSSHVANSPTNEFSSKSMSFSLGKSLSDRDISGGAMLLRLQQTRLLLASMESLSKITSQMCLRELTKALIFFGGEPMRSWMQQVLQSSEDEFDSSTASWYIDQFRNWHTQEEIISSREETIRSTKRNRAKDIPLLQKKIIPREKPLEQTFSSLSRSLVPRVDRRPSMRNGSVINRWADVRTGMTMEEKNILEKFYNRLISDVKPDALIDFLVNRHVLNMEESNEIFSLLKSTDQMQVLLDMLVPKSGNTFVEFLSSLRGRYNFLHQTMMEEYVKLQEMSKANKPDGIPYCQKALHSRYGEICSNWKPFRWYPDLKVNLRTFYCPLLLMDEKGNPVEFSNLFSEEDISSNGLPTRKVVIEGDAGAGKSTLARYLTYNWTTCDTIFGRPFKLAILLNLKIPATSVKTMMMEQLFGGDFKLSEKDMWSVIEENQEDILFILDGYEDNVNEELDAMLSGDLLADSHFLIFSMSSFTSSLMEVSRRKFILTGFGRGQNQTFVKKYSRQTRRPLELFQKLLKKLENVGNPLVGADSPDISLENDTSMMMDQGNTELESFSREASKVFSNSSVGNIGYLPPLQAHGSISQSNTVVNQAQVDSMFHYYSNIPLYCSFLCVIADLRMNVEFTSSYSILEYFLTAVKMKLIERDKESRFSVNKAYSQLMDMALDTIKSSMFTVYIYEEPQNDPLTRFGVLEEATNLLTSDNARYYYPNRVLQEFLAAKCLDVSTPDDSARFFQSVILNRQMHNLAVFYCSMKKNDSETVAMRALLTKIIELNLRMRRSRVSQTEQQQEPKQVQQRKSGLNEKSRKKDSLSDDSSTSSTTQGNIMNFQLSLDCAAVMESRSELGRSISKTLPECVVVQHNGIIPILTLQGLAQTIVRQSDSIKELDIRLNQLSQLTPHAFLQLADAIPQNSNIHTLRILWEDKNLMGHFLRIVCETNVSLRRMECIDESNLSCERLSGQLWSDIRQACQNMNSVKCFAFKQCRHINLVNAIIRNLPNTLEELDLSSSHLNIITCIEVADKIRACKTLRTLILSNVRMEGMAFNSFITSLANNRSITSLDLSRIHLDNVNFFALAESLKANTKLERLYLRQVPLNLRSCEEMVMVMKVNSYLKHIYFTSNRIAEEGRELLLQNARHAKIHGVEVTRVAKVIDPITTIKKYDE